MTSSTKLPLSTPTASRRHDMKTPDDVVAIVALHQLGWGSKRIAGELGIARNTVKRYIRDGGWTPYQQPARERCLDEVGGWLQEQFTQHKGNAAVVLRELAGRCKSPVFGIDQRGSA